MLVAGLLGAFTALALTAVYYFGETILGLPFVPFEIFEQFINVLPGGIITLFIQWMVIVIRGLNLGPTGDVAKLIEQATAVAATVVVGAIFGIVLAALLRRYPWSGARVGAAGGFLLSLLAMAVEFGSGAQPSPLVAVLWIAATMVGWGALLGTWVEDAVRPREATGQGDGVPIRRRDFLARAVGGSLALAIALFGLGSFLRQGRRPLGADEPLAGVTPVPSSPGPSVAGRTVQFVPGTRLEVTPNEDFYRIDINLFPPTIQKDSWSLEVGGLFDWPRRLSLADLMAFPAVTEPRTLSCISNPVGGDLIGNTYWTGVRIPDLMKELGLRPEATGLRIASVDSFYEIVTRADLEDPRTLLVYGMNGQTLPVEHGFPLRILIPNRYGMKQPKWITNFTAIDREQSGYWVERGWSREARPQIVSVIDTVVRDQEKEGRLPIGGIAWAGDRGIRRVEVQVDNGEWQEATLVGPPLNAQSWVGWRYDWPAAPGHHAFRVRATDGTGAVQIEQETSPEPDGATGYHLKTQTF